MLTLVKAWLPSVWRNFQPWQPCTQFGSRIKSMMSKRYHSGLGYSWDFVKGDHAFGRWTLEFLLLSFQSLRECFKIFHFSDGRWSAGWISWSCSTSSRIAPNCLSIQVPCITWPPWEVLVHGQLACIETNGRGGNLTQPSNHFICVSSTASISSASHWYNRGRGATSTIKTQQWTFFVDADARWNGTIHVPWRPSLRAILLVWRAACLPHCTLLVQGANRLLLPMTFAAALQFQSYLEPYKRQKAEGWSKGCRIRKSFLHHSIISIAMSNAYWLGSFTSKTSQWWPVLFTFFFWLGAIHSQLGCGRFRFDPRDPNVANSCIKMVATCFVKCLALQDMRFWGIANHRIDLKDSAFLTQSGWSLASRLQGQWFLWNFMIKQSRGSKHIKEFIRNPTTSYCSEQAASIWPPKVHEISQKYKAWWLVGLKNSNIYHLTVHYQRWNLLSFPVSADLHSTCDLTEHLTANSFWINAWCCSLVTSFI